MLGMRRVFGRRYEVGMFMPTEGSAAAVIEDGERVSKGSSPWRF